MITNSFKSPAVGAVLLLAGIAVAWGQSAMQENMANKDHVMHAMSGDHAGQHGDHTMHDMSGDHADQHGDHTMHGMSADEHAAHRAMMAKKSDLKVSMQSYDVPEVNLLDESGNSVALRSILAGDHPVAVNFIFTTCTTICPVMTATFAQMRKELGSDADRIQLVSITIDPEHDTPSVLAKYAERFDAITPEWRFLTGNTKDVERVLRTFDAWTGTKTNHRPITLMRKQGNSQWVRLEGLGSGIALAEQARTVIQ